MHPHLATERNRIACGEIALALEQCREISFFNKYLGGCNEHKTNLIMCLRQERKDRTAKHVHDAREAKKSPTEAWRRHVENEAAANAES